MRIIAQRVLRAKVIINKQIERKIDEGIMVLVAFEDQDDIADLNWISGKLVRLRIFDDENGIMNKSVMDIQGELMVVSQFTLYASTKKGNRPGYSKSAHPDVAIPLYHQFLNTLEKDFGKPVVTGEFGADMQIELTNNGPVTIMIDSKNKE